VAVEEDWAAVAQAISERLVETRMTQMEVASRAQVSLTTFRELQNNLNPRKRRPQTLAAISEALGWPPHYLQTLLQGGRPEPHVDEATDPILSQLTAIQEELRDLRARVTSVEQRLAAEDGAP
jgi:hypothetical protein